MFFTARGRPCVRCEVIAIGTELLLGQIVDTNSSWIGEQLAIAGQAYVQALRSSMDAGPGPRPDRTQLLTLDGQQVLRVEFLAPSPFGVLSGP